MKKAKSIALAMQLALVLGVGLLIEPAVVVMATVPQEEQKQKQKERLSFTELISSPDKQASNDPPGVKIFPVPTATGQVDFSKNSPDKKGRKRDPAEKRYKPKLEKAEDVLIVVVDGDERQFVLSGAEFPSRAASKNALIRKIRRIGVTLVRYQSCCFLARARWNDELENQVGDIIIRSLGLNISLSSGKKWESNTRHPKYQVAYPVRGRLRRPK